MLYVLDISEQCGFDLKQQVALFESIKRRGMLEVLAWQRVPQRTRLASWGWLAAPRSRDGPRSCSGASAKLRWRP